MPAINKKIINLFNIFQDFFEKHLDDGSNETLEMLLIEQIFYKLILKIENHKVRQYFFCKKYTALQLDQHHNCKVLDKF